MGFETQEEAERWAESMEARADAKREEKLMSVPDFCRSQARCFKPQCDCWQDNELRRRLLVANEEWENAHAKMREREAVLRAALIQIRGMALVQVALGNDAWKIAISEIDKALNA